MTTAQQRKAEQELQRLQAHYTLKTSSSSSRAIAEQDKAIDKQLSYRGKGANNFYQVAYKNSIIGRINRDNTDKQNSFYFLTIQEIGDIANLIAADSKEVSLEDKVNQIQAIEQQARARGSHTQRGAGIALYKYNQKQISS